MLCQAAGKVATTSHDRVMFTWVIPSGIYMVLPIMLLCIYKYDWVHLKIVIANETINYMSFYESNRTIAISVQNLMWRDFLFSICGSFLPHSFTSFNGWQQCHWESNYDPTVWYNRIEKHCSVCKESVYSLQTFILSMAHSNSLRSISIMPLCTVLDMKKKKGGGSGWAPLWSPSEGAALGWSPNK